MDLLALADFNLVASHGGFGRASRASGRPKATLSRRVMELEKSLGVRLLDRGSRSLRLTEEGHMLHARTEGLLGEIAEVGRTIGEGLARPHGKLRVSTPQLFAHVSAGRLAAEFAAAYPDVRLEINAEDRLVDLVEEEYDLAIRTNPSPDDNLVGRCFLRDHFLIVASRSITRPAHGADSGANIHIPAVVRSTAIEDTLWQASDESGSYNFVPDPVLRLSSLIMVRDAVRAGAGVAMLPRSLIAEDLASGRLVSWGIAAGRNVEVWVLHTSRRLASRKVSAFVQFLCDAHAGNSTK